MDPAPPVGGVDDGDGGEQADDDEGHADAEKMVAKLGGDSAMQDDGTGSRKGAHSDEGRGDSADDAAHTVLLSIETCGSGSRGTCERWNRRTPNYVAFMIYVT